MSRLDLEAGWLWRAVSCCSILLARACFPTPPDAMNAGEVRVRTDASRPEILILQGDAYAVSLDCNGAFLSRFTAGGFDLIEGAPLQAHVNTVGIYGPGSVDVVAAGPHYAEVRLRDLRWENLDADIEIALYGYAKRVNAVVTVTPNGLVPKLEIGWIGGARYSMLLSDSGANLRETVSFKGANPCALALVPTKLVQGGMDLRSITALYPTKDLVTKYLYPPEFSGPRRVTLAFVAGRDHADAAEQVQSVANAGELKFDVTGGEYRGYQGREGHYRIDVAETGGDEIRVSIRASTMMPGLQFEQAPCAIVIPGAEFSEPVLNKRAEDGIRIVPQLVVRRPEADDTIRTEVHFPVTVSMERPFDGEIVLKRAARNTADEQGRG